MEKLTITRIGQEKTIEYVNKNTRKPDSFKKVGFLCNEYGERWTDLTFRGEVPIVVGKAYEFEIKENEYVDKSGQTRISYNAQLPRENKSVGLTDGDRALLQQIKAEVYAARQEIVMIRQLLQEKSVIPKHETDAYMPPGDEYPDDINPEDIPF